MVDLKIQPLKSERDGIKKTKLQKEYVMPPPGLTIFVGSTGSGKSVLIANLLSRREMLKNCFDIIYLFCLSPSTLLQDHCDIKDDKIFTADEPEKIGKILEIQKKYIEENGFKKAPHILFILDDCVQSNTFMKSKYLKELAFAGTHSKCSTWVTSQNYTSIIRQVRINCHAMIFIHGFKESELTRLTDEHCSAYLNKDDFIKMVKYATAQKYSFLFINCTHPDKKQMFRKNFDEILVIK